MSPKPDYLYTLEKLSAAIRTLATHPGRIKQRLEAAGVDLALANLKHWPTDEMQRQADRVFGPLSGPADGPESRGRTGSALDEMGEDEARAVASAALSLEAMLEMHVEPE